MKRQFLILSLLAAFTLISCGGNKEEKNNEPSTVGVEESEESQTAPIKATSENFLTDVSTLQAAEKALKDLPQFKGKDIKVFQNIHFYEDGRVMVSLQDPDKPQNIDEYNFRNGSWDKPQPVQISGDGNMDDNVFPLSQIKFETVAEIYKQLEAKAKDVEGAEIDGHIYYNLNVMNQTGRWYTGIKGAREKYSGYFAADGTLNEFNKN